MRKFCGNLRNNFCNDSFPHPDDPYPPNLGGGVFTPRISRGGCSKYCKTSVVLAIHLPNLGGKLHPLNLGSMGCQGTTPQVNCSLISCDTPCSRYPEDTRTRCDTPYLAQPVCCDRAVLSGARSEERSFGIIT